LIKKNTACCLLEFKKVKGKLSIFLVEIINIESITVKLKTFVDFITTF